MDSINEDYIKNIMRARDTRGPDGEVDGQELDRASRSQSAKGQLGMDDGDANRKHQQTEKSLNRSQSYPTIHKDLGSEMADKLNEHSGDDEEGASAQNNRSKNGSPILNPN